MSQKNLNNLKNSCNMGLTSSTVSSAAVRLQDLKEEELANVAEKILQNINTAFDRAEILDEFDIIPQESQSNRSPVIHIEEKLALESWCVPFVYVHSFRHFLGLKPGGKNGPRGYSSSKTSSTPAFISEIFSGTGKNKTHFNQLSEIERIQRGLELSRILVLLNPDLTGAWNFRREAFKQGHTLLKNEMDLITLTTSRKPKCPEGFSYRRWLIQEYLKSEKFRTEQSFDLFQSEAKAVHRAAIKYFSNYHAWNYRHFLLDLFLENNNVPEDQRIAILDYETHISNDWLKAHVSDHSGLHYRQKLMERLAEVKGRSSQEAFELFSNELEENGNLIMYYPGHECLWYYRRALLKNLFENVSSSFDGDLVRQDRFETLKKKDSEFIELVSSSTDGDGSKNQKRKESQEGNSSVQFSSVSQEYLNLNKLYSERHFKWLKYSLLM